jgi:hypothetical protein
MGEKFKIDLASVPSVILRDVDGQKVLKLAIPSLSGRRVFELREGDEVEAVDWLMARAMENFELPKIPITVRTKRDKIKAGKKLGKLEHKPAFYHEHEVRGKKIFAKVKCDG